MSKTFTDEQREHSVKLYVTEGKPIKAVKEYLGCSQPTATKVLRAAGVVIRARGRIPNVPLMVKDENVLPGSKVETLAAPRGRFKELEEHRNLTEPVLHTSEATGLAKAIEESKDRIINSYRERNTKSFVTNG